ncbi:hypothetical protein HanXRQr2_Chr17g0802431 [Helianthus annuus]|uniref:Uncharacterized protein n=1 Tax=Helianthus annuus TaxID=4232 RepID=A0A9K3DI19_HELAN|nr:hypothetical protein HanXRQr2_Chr17g0802431 [Helianthus annuus]
MMAFVGEGCKCVSSELTTAGDFDDPAVTSKGGGMGGNEKGYFGQQLLR